MTYRNPDNSAGAGRGSSRRSPATPRGLFAGNKSVKYGLVAVMACMLIAGFFGLGDEPLTGPIDDVFRHDPSSLLIVYGTDGENTAGLRDYAHKVARLLGGTLDREILVYPDREVDSGLIRESSLLLYGPVDANRVSSRLRDCFPFRFEDGVLMANGEVIATAAWQLVFAVPNPRNDQHYLLVYTGPADSAVIGINILEDPNFVRHDTTDYVLAVDGRIKRSGYFLKDDPGRWSLPR